MDAMSHAVYHYVVLQLSPVHLFYKAPSVYINQWVCTGCYYETWPSDASFFDQWAMICDQLTVLA